MAIILTESSLRAETCLLKFGISRCMGWQGDRCMDECHEWMNGWSRPTDEVIKRRQCCFRGANQYHFLLWLGVAVWTSLTGQNPRLVQNLQFSLTTGGTHGHADSAIFSDASGEKNKNKTKNPEEGKKKRKKQTPQTSWFTWPQTPLTSSLRCLHFLGTWLQCHVRLLLWQHYFLVMAVTGSGDLFVRIWPCSQWIEISSTILSPCLPSPPHCPCHRFLIPFPPFFFSKQENVTVNPTTLSSKVPWEP